MYGPIGKKAQIEYMAELVFSLLLYFVILILLMFVASKMQLTVNAKINEDSTQFACQNDLHAFINFDTNKEDLFKIYVANYETTTDEYIRFKTNAEKIFNGLAGTMWELQIKTPEQNSAHKIGACKIGDKFCSKTVSCSTFIPLPCEDTDCLLRIILVRGYG